MKAVAGLDGVCRAGQWIPVQVTLENQGSDLDGRVGVRIPRFGQNDVVYAQPISLPSASRKESFVYVYPEGFLDQLEVTLWSGNDVIERIETPVTCVSARDWVFGVISDDPDLFNELVVLGPPNGRTYIAQLEVTDLPDRVQALQAVLNALVISNADTGKLSDRQLEALESWLAAGGRLLVTGGPNWAKTAASLGELLPFQPDGTAGLGDLQALARFSRLSSPAESQTIIATGSVRPEATVLYSQEGAPLIVSGRMGAGAIHYLTFDPGLEPVRSWDNLVELYESLLAQPVDQPVWSSGFLDWDAAGSAVGVVPGLELPSALLVCGFLGTYILAIGPINYLFLRRLGKRELAWFSIPLLVIFFSGLAFLIGGRSRGNLPVLNRLAVVQAWNGARLARVDGLVGVFSPTREKYDLQLDRGVLSHPLRALAGGQSSDWLFLEGPQGILVPEMRVEVGGISSLAVTGTTTAPVFESRLTIDVRGRQATLAGEITYISGPDLAEAVLLAPGTAHRIERFVQGESRQIDLSFTEAQRSGRLPASSPYFYPDESIVDDVLGASYFPSYGDSEDFRRFSLLSAITNHQSGGGGRGGGVYLVGWVDEFPLELGLIKTPFDSIDTSFYIVELEALFPSAQERLVIPPGLMTWEVFDSGYPGRISPYGMNLEQGSYSLRFTPSQQITFSAVESVTLHLKSYGRTGTAPLGVYLWNFRENSWNELEEPVWGDIEVTGPERFVGINGELRMRLENRSGQSVIDIEASDITMVLLR